MTDHKTLGVGARITLAPMSDNFITILLGALQQTDRTGVEVTPDEISTHISGTEDDILRYLQNLIANVAASGVHTVAQITLSRGCPGEATCDRAEVPLGAPRTVAPLPSSNLPVTAQWSLYPLLDGAPLGESGDQPSTAPSVIDHMVPIMAAIDRATQAGIAHGSKHFVTELRGDLSQVLTTIGEAWVTTGAVVAHVVSTATININHPTAEQIAAATGTGDNR